MRFPDGLDAGGQRLQNVGTPTASTDGVPKSVADAKLAYQGGWSPGVIYNVNDVVSYNNKLYACITPNGQALSFVGAVLSGFSGAATALPSGSAAGDIAIMVIGAYNSTPTVPTGWTQISSASNNTGRSFAYSRTLSSADITAGSIPGIATGQRGGVYFYRGAAVTVDPTATSYTTPAVAGVTGYLLRSVADVVTNGGGAINPPSGVGMTDALTAADGSTFVWGGAQEYFASSSSAPARTFTTTAITRGYVTALTINITGASIFDSTKWVEIAALGAYTDASISTEDALVVHLAGAETFTGAKTFTASTTLSGLRNVPGVRTATITLTIASAASLQFCDATSGSVTITLPATAQSGWTYTFKRIDSAAGNTVTIAGTIDGQTNYVLSAQYKYVTLVSSGTSGVWYIISNN